MNRKLKAVIGVLALAVVSIFNPTQAGSISGPIFWVNVVPAHFTHYYDIVLEGSVTTFISVSGDGSTDLDLFVRDEYGNLVDSDTDYTDECRASIRPRHTGYFRIFIENRGDWANAYSLSTN